MTSRPHSRIGLRPRPTSQDNSPDEKRPDSRLGIRQHPVTRYTSPYDDQLLQADLPSAFSSSPRRSRSAGPPFSEAGLTNSSRRRARSADGLRLSGNTKNRFTTARKSDEEYGYLHSTVSFNSYRKNVRDSFGTSRSASPQKKPFVPSSFSTDGLREGRSSSTPRDRRRIGSGCDVHMEVAGHRESNRERKRSHSRVHRPSKSRDALKNTRYTFLTSTAKFSGAMGRKHKVDEGRRVSGSGRVKKVSGGNKKRAASEAACLVEELGQSMMQELSKVVDLVSSDLRVVSQQLQTLSTSMSDSILAVNASRDMSRTYGGAHQDISRSYDTSDVIGYGDDEVKPMVHSDMYHHSKNSSHNGSAPSKPPSSTNKTQSSRYTYSTSVAPSAQSDSDRILTEMIQEGIRNKLILLMRDSSD